jgi:threonine dehydrogenase-like Zn-dependent dehydrogenase
MRTKAVRLYGANDMRLEEFDLPEMKDTEILMRVVTDSLCTSTCKAVKRGAAHKRVPNDVSERPIIVGHELCGEIVAIGAAVKGAWYVGQKVVIQPALKLETNYDVGYSYQFVGGSATYAVVPEIVLERNCLIPYAGEAYFEGSLAEAFGCIIRGFKGMYHTNYESYTRTDGAKRGGRLAILGGTGPMGIGAVELASVYAGAKQVVVTGRSADKLAFAAEKSPVGAAAQKGCELHYFNVSESADPVAQLLELSDGGFDDVLVMAPSPELFEMADAICRFDGCINFFAGPADEKMQGKLNLHRVHYDGIHVVGTAGGIPIDMVDALGLLEKKSVNAGALVSHILGLNATVDTLDRLNEIGGAKKVCYNELDIPLIALSDLPELGKRDPMYARLAEIVAENGGLWCLEAEKYLLAHAPRI